MFLFITTSGIRLGIFENFHDSQRTAPEAMRLQIMTQEGREYVT